MTQITLQILRKPPRFVPAEQQPPQTPARAVGKAR
jgi:hypothetical protein